MPVRGHVGSDYERLRPEFRVIPNPWSPSERIMLVPPIAPDVALIHADRKSTRLNSSHGYISYAVFCLKKKNNHVGTDVDHGSHREHAAGVPQHVYRPG